MNKIYKIAFILCWASFICLSCTDRVEMEEGEIIVGQQERVPMKFAVSGWLSTEVSPMDTRVLMSDDEQRSLVGEEIGLYIMLESDYENVLQGLPLQSEYRYMNVRGTIMSDGSIAILDTVLYYPLYKEAKVAVVAYSPYREDMSDNILYNGGIQSIESNQTSIDGFYISDFLTGKPESGNPFRDVAADGTPQSTQIVFSHAYSRVVVTIDMPYKEAVSKYERIFVTLDNAPLSANVNFLSNYIEVLPESKGSIVMLDEMLSEQPSSDSGITSGNGTDDGWLRGNGDIDTPAHTRAVVGGNFTFQAAAIVFPQETTSLTPPQFTITLKGRQEIPDTTIVRTDTFGTVYMPGRDVRYRIRIGSGNSLNSSDDEIDYDKDMETKRRGIWIED